jgi:hypothetical protein
MVTTVLLVLALAPMLFGIFLEQLPILFDSYPKPIRLSTIDPIHDVGGLGRKFDHSD